LANGKDLAKESSESVRAIRKMELTQSLASKRLEKGPSAGLRVVPPRLTEMQAINDPKKAPANDTGQEHVHKSCCCHSLSMPATHEASS
jgi:hypothetical protein